MPILKPISGHTSVRPAMRYLTKDNRAIAADYINLQAPIPDRERIEYDWAAAMDATRHELGNDKPWGKMRARTYKHYIVSPDPEDRIDLVTLRDLATAWASEHFGDYEVAIVYHDDNASGIPHAHIIVNNTNLETGRRLQDPDPTGLNHSLQRMADERRLRRFPDISGPSSETGRTEKLTSRGRPQTLQREYARKAESELLAKGEYSWTADIRARVRIARIVARNEAEFRGALAAMGIEVSDNSPKAARRDWVYSLAGHPTRRISGERLGLSYGRERLLSSFALNGIGHLPDRSERVIARIAKSALEVGDLGELNRLSRALSLIEANSISYIRDLNTLMERGYSQKAWPDPDAAEAMDLARFIAEAGILPETVEPAIRVPASGRRGYFDNIGKALSDRDMDAHLKSDGPMRNLQSRDDAGRGRGR